MENNNNSKKLNIKNHIKDTIIAPISGTGIAAISVIRLSGNHSIEIVNRVFEGKNLCTQPPNTIHFGILKDKKEIIDEVLISIFKAPHSFTKEDSIEISCHGSPYIVQRILQLMIKEGARMAKPGEFTQRAFLNGQFDLSQAEAVADLISSSSEASHKLAINQLRGGVSNKIEEFRKQLIHFASLLELELDFVEEDVEFASKDHLHKLIESLLLNINTLITGFKQGNAIKEGIPIAIVGKPNAGKSTLLNTLINEDKAIVSNIPGTTRDIIEDQIIISGLKFRFIDTAGIRTTKDTIESLGIKKTYETMDKASLIIYLIDLSNQPIKKIEYDLKKIRDLNVPFLIVGNKIDDPNLEIVNYLKKEKDIVFISASKKENIEKLKQKIISIIELDKINLGDIIITNSRHFESLVKSKESLLIVIEALNLGLSNELIIVDLKMALNYLGEITGKITNDDLLDNIFSKFCIGK